MLFSIIYKRIYSKIQDCKCIKIKINFRLSNFYCITKKNSNLHCKLLFQSGAENENLE